MESEFAKGFTQRLEAFGDGLADNVGSALALGEPTAVQVLRFFLEAACQSQRMEAIELGRRNLLSLPRSWVLGAIENAAKSTLDLTDEYEYRRLLEVTVLLGNREAVKRLIDLGRKSDDSDLNDTAKEFEDSATEPDLAVAKVRRVSLPGFMRQSAA